MLVTGFTYSAIFAYLSGATYILQGVYGLSPQGYSFAFGLNSLGFVIFGFIAGRLAERWSERGGLAAPIVGIGGADTAVPFGIVAVVSAASVALCLALVGRRREGQDVTGRI